LPTSSSNWLDPETSPYSKVLGENQIVSGFFDGTLCDVVKAEFVRFSAFFEPFRNVRLSLASSF
jgi:hypothetical protein